MDRICKMKVADIVAPVSPSKAFFFWTLRGGSIFVGIIETVLSIITAILLFLAWLNTDKVLDMFTFDVKEIQDRALATEGLLDSLLNFTKYEIQYKLDKTYFGQLVADWIMPCLGMLGLHLCCSVLLLFGTIRKNKTCILPWATSMVMNIFTTIFGLLALGFVPGLAYKYYLYGLGSIFLTMEMYSWYIAFCYYYEK